MNSSLLSLVLIAFLLVILGAVGIGAIYLVAHRYNCNSDNKKIERTDQSIDPWEEAGRRQQ
jgi:hypothetical protein